MAFEIKSRYCERVIYSSKAAKTIKEAVLEAVRSGCNLRGSDLSGCNLSDSNLSPIKFDFFAVLLYGINEIPGLRKALIEGRIDGTAYEGKCACLVGTIANVKGCTYECIPGLSPDEHRPAERFFLMIARGHTPENSQAAKLAVEWIDEFNNLIENGTAVPA